MKLKMNALVVDLLGVSIPRSSENRKSPWSKGKKRNLLLVSERTPFLQKKWLVGKKLDLFGGTKK